MTTKHVVTALALASTLLVGSSASAFAADVSNTYQFHDKVTVNIYNNRVVRPAHRSHYHRGYVFGYNGEHNLSQDDLHDRYRPERHVRRVHGVECFTTYYNHVCVD